MPAAPFTEAHEALRAEVRAWVAGELRPRVDGWERAGGFPRELFAELAAKGWLGLGHPVEHGGGGLDFSWGAVLSEELARCGSQGVAAGIGAHVGIATPPIARFGTVEQRRRWLEPALRGQSVAALAITEPGAGSDVASLRTRADRVDGGWLVNGTKTFITNGVRADFMVTAVRTSASTGGHAGISLLVVDRQDGVRSSGLAKLGWHASDTAEIFFDDVFVPEEALLGEENQGFYLIMANFQGERLGMALMALGEMRQAFEETVEWLRSRPHVSQHARHSMAELATRVEVSAAMTYATLRRYVAGEDMVREVTAAKLFTQRACLDVVDGCMRLRGVEGVLRDTGLERALRDARLGPIGGGTDEIMREILGRSLGL